MDSKKYGIEGEQLACEWYALRGYAVRERNWRPKNSHLEVDLITQKDDEVVFVEVKSRRDADFDPAEAVDETKMRKLVRAASIYLSGMEREDLDYRFDIVTVSGDGDSAEIDVIEDAFLPPLG